MPAMIAFRRLAMPRSGRRGTLPIRPPSTPDRCAAGTASRWSDRLESDLTQDVSQEPTDAPAEGAPRHPHPKPENRPELSVIVPFLNEAEVLPSFVRELRPVLDAAAISYEVLFVNDGSTDDGPRWVAEQLHAEWPQAHLINLTRNFGHMAALTAGLNAAQGDYVASMDADLQHPPAVLAEMFTLARTTGVPVVQGLRQDRTGQEGWRKRVFSRWYYTIMSKLAGVTVQPGSADFRVMSRQVVQELRALPESARVYRLLIPWMGYQTVFLSYEVGTRRAGRSKYNYARMISLAWSSLKSFSSGPLRVATGFGIFTGVCGSFWLLYVLVSWYLGNTVPGWSALMSALLILGGVQLVTIGLVGEYLAVVLDQVRGRPTYIVDRSDGLPRPPADPADSSFNLTSPLGGAQQ